MPLISYILLIFFCSVGSGANAALSFDHQFTTVDDAKYVSIRSFFSRPEVGENLGTRWIDDSSESKGFLFFPNDTYLEIWKASSVPFFLGYQEGLRVSDLNALKQIASELGKEVTDHGKGFFTVGRLGTTGYPLGGVFYIYTKNTKVHPDLPGITQTFIAVPGEIGGGVNQALIQDYERADLDITKYEDGRFLVASDTSGVERNVVAAEPGSKSDLIAIGFVFAGSKGKRIVQSIHADATGTDSVYLWTEGNIGTLVFDNVLFKRYFPILQRNR